MNLEQKSYYGELFKIMIFLLNVNGAELFCLFIILFTFWNVVYLKLDGGHVKSHKVIIYSNFLISVRS